MIKPPIVCGIQKITTNYCMSTNTQVRLARRPQGLPTQDDWSIEDHPVPTPGEGEFLMKILYVSLDPAMRGWISERRSYMPPVPLGEVMRAGTVGQVIESNHPDYPVGTHAVGWNGVQQYAVSNGEGMYAVDPSLAPLPTYLGTLGMPGFTAYFGLLNVGQPKEGDTLLVSAAAGAVGSVVGQIGKIKGCKVIGIAGGPEKCAYIVDELGFDGAIDYKNESLYPAVKRECPKGIDIYFDNVGGEMLDVALAQIRMNARIVICGAISQYNQMDKITGPKNYMSLLVNRARMEGMLVMDYAKDYGAAAREMGLWMRDGKLKSREFVVEGIRTFPETFHRLFTGQKMGKLVLKVDG